ncbi:4-hydroxyphenylpyruvate dioxygenase [Longispora sp. NPDC051575]|uniref:4-hydroxyphenylpyruvate dioxygenase n=1 Tax=Longispora sp. NPDC051575 TaxID=3154943 RepID=UPI00341BC81E
MNISGIDHVEFYVGDARQTAFYLCTAFGFRISGQGGPETGLAGQRSLLLRQGDVRIVLTSGLVPDHPATRYVGRHGDGVAIIAFEVDDVEAVYAETVRRGAEALEGPATYADDESRVVTATVSGFGDVAHRLVERHGPTRTFLPGAIKMLKADKAPDEGLLELIDHAAICVPAGELATTAEYYERVFGFSEIFEEYIEVGGQAMDSKVVQSPSKGVTFTLIEPDTTRTPGQIDDFLQWHAGAGVQHLAFQTKDIVQTVATLASRGVKFLSTPDSYYETLESRLGPVDLPLAELQKLGVLVDRDHWGQMFQIFTQSMHIRRTLFLEVIERHGALTFGSGNIKALYEAKERERSGAAS